MARERENAANAQAAREREFAANAQAARERENVVPNVRAYGEFYPGQLAYPNTGNYMTGNFTRQGQPYPHRHSSGYSTNFNAPGGTTNQGSSFQPPANTYDNQSNRPTNPAAGSSHQGHILRFDEPFGPSQHTASNVGGFGQDLTHLGDTPGNSSQQNAGNPAYFGHLPSSLVNAPGHPIQPGASGLADYRQVPVQSVDHQRHPEEGERFGLLHPQGQQVSNRPNQLGPELANSPNEPGDVCICNYDEWGYCTKCGKNMFTIE